MQLSFSKIKELIRLNKYEELKESLLVQSKDYKNNSRLLESDIYALIALKLSDFIIENNQNIAFSKKIEIKLKELDASEYISNTAEFKEFNLLNANEKTKYDFLVETSQTLEIFISSLNNLLTHVSVDADFLNKEHEFVRLLHDNPCIKAKFSEENRLEELISSLSKFNSDKIEFKKNNLCRLEQKIKKFSEFLQPIDLICIFEKFKKLSPQSKSAENRILYDPYSELRYIKRGAFLDYIYLLEDIDKQCENVVFLINNLSEVSDDISKLLSHCQELNKFESIKGEFLNKIKADLSHLD